MTNHEGLVMQSSSAFYNPPTSGSSITGPVTVETSNSFQRLWTTLEQSLQTATRSKKLPPTPYFVDELAALGRTAKGKEKEKLKAIHKDKMNIIRKVTFRRGRVSPSNSTPANHPQDKARVAYVTPSLVRQASMSSLALHTSLQALSSPGSSSSNTDALISSTRQRTRKVHTQLPEISVPLSNHSSPNTPASSSPLSRHPSPSSRLPQSPLPHPREPTTPTRTGRDVSTSPDILTPKAQLVRHTSKSSVIVRPTLSASSPIRSKSPSNRVRVVSSSVGALTSLPSSTPPPTPRRSINTSRRASDTLHRPSTECLRHASPINIREGSPSPRSRTRSPTQRSYSQNHHFDISSGSLVLPNSNPEYRELLRKATSLICKEVLTPPLHLTRTEAGQRDWGEVEARTRALARLERIWGQSGNGGACSSTNASTAALLSSSGLTSGEEGERRLFCEALRDGYVLCQCVFLLHHSRFDAYADH